MLTLLTTLSLAAAPQAVDLPGTLQTINVPAEPTGIVMLDVELDGQAVELFLEPYSLRSADFTLMVSRPDGSVIEVPAPAPNTWRGMVTGWEDSVVTATINDEGLTAIVADDARDAEWQIQPALGQPRGVYSVANKSQLPPTTGTCGVPNNAVPFDDQLVPGTSNLGTGLQVCEIALDADFEFYQRNGSSVEATIDDMERIMNRCDTIYVRDCDVTFQITGVIVRSSSNDPYTTNNPSSLLGQFRSEWSSNFSGVRRDLAHLFTGRNIQGGVIGIAFLGVVCSQANGYGLSESRFTGNLVSRTGLTAHEIGHNFNAGHCDGNGDCRIMCSGLGGCNNDLTRFGAPRANSIRNYAISRNCLLDLSPPVAVPFFDDFPTNSISTDLWISNQGVTASPGGFNEPSSPNAANFAALNADLLRDDRLISNKILLGSLTDVVLSFYTQHRGVPAGGALDIEILDNSSGGGDWILLERVVSDGVDESIFQFHSIQLPANALHDEAQLRITADVDSNAQQWFVDDVLVDDNTCGGISNYCVGATNSVSVGGASLSSTGSNGIAANDLVMLTTGLPPNTSGVYIYGDQQTQSFLGDGFLCVTGTPVYRAAIVQADVFGLAPWVLDQDNLPPGSVILAGDTVNFQFWYRDSIGTGVNLSDGLSVEFCP